MPSFNRLSLTSLSTKFTAGPVWAWCARSENDEKRNRLRFRDGWEVLRKRVRDSRQPSTPSRLLNYVVHAASVRDFQAIRARWQRALRFFQRTANPSPWASGTRFSRPWNLGVFSKNY